ncbi:MAG: hypothetical protein AAGB26_14120 [Planctomycetota bacterium]
MSFRQRRSTWPGDPDQSLDHLEGIGIPKEALSSETKFIQYLIDGSASDLGPHLNDLSTDQFWDLFAIVDSWYGMDKLNFKAFQARREHSLEQQ